MAGYRRAPRAGFQPLGPAWGQLVSEKLAGVAPPAPLPLPPRGRLGGVAPVPSLLVVHTPAGSGPQGMRCGLKPVCASLRPPARLSERTPIDTESQALLPCEYPVPSSLITPHQISPLKKITAWKILF